MIRRVLYSLFLALATLTPAFSQTVKPGLEVGTVVLRLGMSCESVTLLLNKAGYKLLNATGFKSNSPQIFHPEKTSCAEDAVLVVTREDTTDPVKVAFAMVTNDGRLFFRNRLLVRIQRELNLPLPTDRGLAAALYASIHEYEKEGTNRVCSAGTSEETPAESPGIEVKQITLLCSLGRRTYRAIHIRWTTSMQLREQMSVVMFQELWAE